MLLVTAMAALVPLVHPTVELPIWQHHLLHAGLLMGSALAGILVVPRTRSGSGGGAFWLLPAILAPIVAMFAMWPSGYSYFETHPWGHIVEHFVLIALGCLSTYAAETYAFGLGWVVGGAMVFMAVAAARGFGVSFGNGS